MSAENEHGPSGTPTIQREEHSKGSKDDKEDRKIIFNFKTENPKERLSKGFRKALSESKNAVIVLIYGPGRQGKSTLMNFLTKEGYSLPSMGSLFYKDNQVEGNFEVREGTDPCTKNFEYVKMSESEFRGIHGIPPYNSNNYDIFFIDSEGFDNTAGISNDLFLGLFTLMGVACVQLYLNNSVITNGDRMKCLAESIISAKILGNKKSKVISISRGTIAISGDPQLDELNEQVLTQIRNQDKDHKKEFLSGLKQRVDLGDYSVSTISIPDYISFIKVAYKELLTDLSKMILEGAQPRNGKELLNNEFSDAFDLVKKHKTKLVAKDDKGIVSMNTVYNNLMKYFIEKAMTKGEDVSFNQRSEIFEKTQDQLKEMQRNLQNYFELVKQCEKKERDLNSNGGQFDRESAKEDYDSLMKQIKEKHKVFYDIVSVGCSAFNREIKTIINEPKNLNSIVQGYLKEKERSLKNIINDKIENLIKQALDLKDTHNVMGRLYEENRSLDNKNVGDIVEINLLNGDGVLVPDKKMRVKIMNDMFDYENDGNIQRLHYLFPAGITITEYSLTTTKEYFTVVKCKTKYNTPDGKHSEKNINEQFSFNFNDMKIVPKEEMSGPCSSYVYTCNYKLLIFSVVTIREKFIQVSLNILESDLWIKECRFTRYNWAGWFILTKKPKEKKIEYPALPFYIKAKDNTNRGKGNQVFFVSATFELKDKPSLFLNQKQKNKTSIIPGLLNMLKEEDL